MIRRPLLAAKTTEADLQNLTYPMLLSPKIDGIRALVVGGKLLSRSMKPIPNAWTQALFGRPELEGLDGELVVGNPWDKNLMQQTTSGVMSHGGVPDVKFWVFDKWNEYLPFFDRYKVAQSVRYKLFDSACVALVHHEFVDSYEHLIILEQEYLAKGYEGVMLRDPGGPYKAGRSTLRERTLLKVKRFVDGEAKIIGVEPLYRNANAATLDERGYTKRSSHSANQIADDCLGSLTVKSADSGQTFNIGSGFTEAQRYSLWANRHSLLGRIVKYKSFAVTGVLDKPRFPIFLGFRDPLDM